MRFFSQTPRIWGGYNSGVKIAKDTRSTAAKPRTTSLRMRTCCILLYASIESRSSNSIRMAEMRVSFIKSPNGSFPIESDSDLDNDNQQKTSKSRRFCIGKESSAYQELRELRLPSVHINET